MCSKAEVLVFTAGHSSRSAEEFIKLLNAYGIERVIDVRTVPKSRHNPQFNRLELSRTLRNRRIGYRHMKALGGFRKPLHDSLNTGWTNDSFRGFADYMQTPAFDKAVDVLIRLAGEKPTAIMCAEAVPWRCHRYLISDSLVVRGCSVEHIMSKSNVKPHRLNPMAKVFGGKIIYPKPKASDF